MFSDASNEEIAMKYQAGKASAMLEDVRRWTLNTSQGEGRNQPLFREPNG